MGNLLSQVSEIVSSKLFVKLLLEFLPLGLFFIATDQYNIYIGTWVLMVATVISTALIWIFYKRVAIMALITAATGLVSGGMTIFLTDPMWVKLKPTIVSFFFGFILLFGLWIDRPLLKSLLGEDLNLTHQGWRVITYRWMWYFMFIAVLNEVVWRGADWWWQDVPRFADQAHAVHPADQFWAGFKAFGLMPITILYAALQLPLLKKFREDHSRPVGGADILTDGGGQTTAPIGVAKVAK
jgi:intracellular septation protein